MAAKKKSETRKKTGGRILSWILVILLIAGIGVFAASRYYMVLGGHFYRKDVSELDVRGEDISVQRYEELREQMPDARIQWDVPLSGGSFDADAKSISVVSFVPEDLELLGYFTGLQSIDATAASLTAEEYGALKNALPGCAVRWSVPLGSERYPSDAEEIALAALSEDDLDQFEHLENLKRVDARGCSDYDAILALREARPDLEVLWQVPLAGVSYPQDAEEIKVEDPSVTAEALSAALAYLPEVKTVNAPKNTWTDAEKKTLLSDWPEIAFKWPVKIAGKEYDGTETEIDLSGTAVTAKDLEDLRANGSFLPSLARVDLTGCGLAPEDVLPVKEALPDTEFVFDFELYGVKINTMDEFIDFTGKAMESPDKVEAILPLMPRLQKVDMSDCGISDEDMDALNKRHDNVRFVWTMHITRYNIRTDDVGFIGSMEHYGAFDANTIRKLTYCEDMICLDLGHRIPFNDLSFLYEMPQIKYLVLADCRTYDITPIGSLKNLIYLEMILSYATDLSPLLDCTSLVDLDVAFCNNTDKEKNFEVFTAMSGQLERLWYSSYMISDKKKAELKELMPNTEIYVVYAITDATGGGWRYNAHYYEMRDLLNMYYMGDYGGRQFSRIIDGVEEPLDPEFLENQRLPDFSKMRA